MYVSGLKSTVNDIWHEEEEMGGKHLDKFMMGVTMK